MKTDQVFVSVDVEADGPCPGLNSMLSLGASSFSETGADLGNFEINLAVLDGAVQDPRTMAWWQTEKQAWDACRSSTVKPDIAIGKLVVWLDSLAANSKGGLTFVGYPTGFDFTYVYWYLHKFAGRSPFSFSALDLKSYAAGKLGIPYKSVTKRLLKKYFPVSGLYSHTHVALDDAREQAELAKKILGMVK